LQQGRSPLSEHFFGEVRGKRLFPFSELLALALLGKILLLPAKSGPDG
jgi:hypothetical protein